MAILGIEAGGFVQGIGDSFLESPMHARDTNLVSTSSTFDFIFDYLGIPGGSNTVQINDDQSGNQYLNGTHAHITNIPGYQYALGSGWIGLTYTQFYGSPPPGGETGQISFFVAPTGSDISFKVIPTSVSPSGIYTGFCGFGFINGSGQPGLQMSGSVSFQIISADFSQIVDVTPANCGTTAQGIVPITFNSSSLFGRNTSFFPRCSMTSQNDPHIRHSSTNQSPSIIFSPSLNMGKTG